MTGAIVRVTGSGLGCPTWPECFPGSMVPVSHPEYATLNQWIEYGNRLFTGVVGLIAAAAFVLALLDKPRDRRYLRLAIAMPVGVAVQAVLGGITVRLDLVWWSVAIHLLASTVMVWLATLLVHAVPRDDARPGIDPGNREPDRRALAVRPDRAAGRHPRHRHDGHRRRPARRRPGHAEARRSRSRRWLTCTPRSSTRSSVRCCCSASGSARVANPPWRRYLVMVGVVLAQGTIGLVQFWTGVPELLVSLHVLGAMSVVIATASLWCGIRGDRPGCRIRVKPDKATVASAPPTPYL